jgi:hypothetical protein
MKINISKTIAILGFAYKNNLQRGRVKPVDGIPTLPS